MRPGKSGFLLLSMGYQRYAKAGLWLTAAGIGAGLFAASKRAGARRKRRDLNGAKILIAGGSRGLGLALARELGQRGARLALSSRDAAELEEAKKSLAENGIDAHLLPSDVASKSDAEAMVRQAAEALGGIDILINNAGKIAVGPFESLTQADFEDAMNLMFWAPVNLTYAALPHLLSSDVGQIVNITSVGGRVSVPHLLPYCCAKFALVGFSTGLGVELKPKGIEVITVVPGLMRTGSYLNAEFKGKAKNEFTWFGLLGNLPGFSVSAGHAAREIKHAMETGKRVCTISLPAEILIALETLAPNFNRRAMEQVNDAVSATALTRTYGDGGSAVHALRGVSLEVPQGQFAAVMGPSGSGKSTLMHLLAGLDTPDAGAVHIAGQDVTRMSDRELTRLRRKHIGFVFQSFNLLPTLSAEENVLLPLAIAGRKPEPHVVDALLERMGLAERRDHKPAQLSGGQQQRVAVARALICTPTVLFADEPTGNLD